MITPNDLHREARRAGCIVDVESAGGESYRVCVAAEHAHLPVLSDCTCGTCGEEGAVSAGLIFVCVVPISIRVLTVCSSS